MTTIIINEKLKTTVVTTDDPAKKKKLKSIAELTPEKCEYRCTSPDGSETYFVDYKLVRIKTPLRHDKTPLRHEPDKVGKGKR